MKRGAAINLAVWIALILLVRQPVAFSADTQPSTWPTHAFENEIAAFEAADRKRMPPADATLFVGSSSIRFWTTLATDFPEFPTINRGFGGSHIPESTFYADRIIFPYHPRQIVFYAGDNDLADGKTPEHLRDDFREFITKVRSRLPDAPICFISIKPSLMRLKIIDKIREANNLIREDIGGIRLGPDGKPRKGLFRSDGLHMVQAGYELWTSILKPMLDR